MSVNYHHVQRVPDKVMTAAGLAGLGLGLTPPGMLMRLVIMAALGTAVVTLRCLTVEVDDKKVNLRFGDGLIKKSFALSDVSAAQTTRTRPLQGWGIHWIGSGWLYNIYGLDAVELVFKNG